MQIYLHGNEGIVYCQCIYQVWCMCPSASYISQDIDRKYIPDCSRCTAQSTRTPNPASTLSDLLLFAACGFCWLSASVASSQTRCHYHYHVRVCTTKTMVLHCQYNDSAVHAAFPQRFTPETTDKFGVWISLLLSLAMFAMRAAFQDQLSPEDSHLAKSLGRLYM